MTTFTGTSAIALTWSADGHCRGLSVRRHRDQCRIVGYWECEPRPDRGVNEMLTDGLRELGAHESTVVVASGEDLSCGVIDLQTPKLKAEELHNALAFELRRSAPVADEKLIWAYRVLPESAGGQLRVRLYYLRQAVWERWLNDVSGLVHGLDMVIPPAAALDPVLAGMPVALGSSGKAFVFKPSEGFSRDSIYLEGDEEDETVFGLGNTPLACPGLDAEALSGLTAQSQRTFAGCAVLAMYGLSHTFTADRHTGLVLPYELRPRRHRHSRLLAAALLLYVLIVGCFGAVRLYQAQRQEFAKLHRERLALEKRIDRIAKRVERDETKFMSELSAEIGDLAQPRPSMAAALAEVTRRVGHDGWCTAFRWRDGSISLQLRETKELEDLERTLEYSPLLGDVRQEYKKVRSNMIDRKIEMNARYDFEDEQSEPPPSKNVEASPGEEPDDAAVPDDAASEKDTAGEAKRPPAADTLGAKLRKRFLQPPPPPPMAAPPKGD